MSKNSLRLLSILLLQLLAVVGSLLCSTTFIFTVAATEDVAGWVKHELYFGQSIQLDSVCEALFKLAPTPSPSDRKGSPAPSSGVSSSALDAVFPTPGKDELDSDDEKALTASTRPVDRQLVCPERIIQEAEFNAFLELEVVPRFPDGFSVMDAKGYYRHQETNKSISERSKVLVLFTPPSTTETETEGSMEAAAEAAVRSEGLPALAEQQTINANLQQETEGKRSSDGTSNLHLFNSTDQRIEDIIELYKWYFQQESVLWARQGASVQFV